MSGVYDEKLLDLHEELSMIVLENDDVSCVVSV